MDMNANIKRNKPKEVKQEPKVIFTLNCKLEELPNSKDSEEYKFSGKVKADKMDTDLMASVLVHIIKEAVPEPAIEDVVNLVAERLDLVSSEQYDCDCESCKSKTVHIDKPNNRDLFLNFINKILGE